MFSDFLIDLRPVLLKWDQDPSQSELLAGDANEATAALDEENLSQVYNIESLQQVRRNVANVPNQKAHCKQNGAEYH